MVDNTPGSTVPRRSLGLSLRQARESAGVGLKAAAEHVDISESTLRRMENGTTSTRITSVMALCDLYGVNGQLREVLLGLARESKSRGWWHAYGEVIPGWFELYVGLEQTASSIRVFESALIPGLLQHADYARAVIQADRPELTSEEVLTRIELRQSRQRLLTRSFPQPPRMTVIITEAILLAELQPLEIMRRQIWHLLQATELANVAVRVLPAAAGPHRASVAGAFTLLNFADENGSTPPSIAYSENLTGAVYLDKPSEIDTYDAAWAAISAIALNQPDSIALLSEKLKELNDRESD